MAEFRRPFFREQGNRQPLRGRVDLGVSAPPQTRPGGVTATPDRTAPPPPVRPRPDRRQQPTPEQRPEKPKKHTARNIVLVGTGGLAVAAGGYAIVRTVAPEFLSHLRGDQLVSTDTKPERVFDNGADKVKITERNTVILPLQEQAGQLGLDRENDTLTMTFPFDLPEGQSIVIERATSNWQPTQELLEETRRKGIKDDTVFKLPPGTTIKAPSFMKEEPTEYKVMLTQDPNDPDKKIDSVRVFAYYPEENVTVVTWFFNLGRDPNKIHFEPMIPMQEDVDWSGEGWKKLPTIKSNTPLVKTITNQLVQMDLQIYRGQNADVMLGGIRDKALSRVTPYYPTDPAGRLALTPPHPNP